MSNGNLYVISAPSGTGKTTLVKALTEMLPNLTVSISHTTRAQRPAEIDGINYHFIDHAHFENMIANNEFLEHAQVFNNQYGTSRRWVEETLKQDKDVILEIDWQGCRQITQLFPECVSIFILPPSLEALSKRLISRQQDDLTIISQRLADVKEATTHLAEFNYVVVNDDFNHALNDLSAIISCGRLQGSRQRLKYAQLINDLCHIEKV